MSSRGGVPLPGGAKWNNFDKKPGAAAGANSGGGAPSAIKCSICKKAKTKEDFSKRQLLKFSSYTKNGRAYNKDPNSVHITCTLCTAGQVSELKCYVCDKTKGLDQFAKSQRKDPDNARCTKCVDFDVQMETDLVPEIGEGAEVDSSDDEGKEHKWDGAAKSAANKIKPYKKSASALSTNDDYYEEEGGEYDEYEDLPASSTQDYNGVARSGRSSAAFNPRANEPSNRYTSRAAPPADDDDEWETPNDSRRSAGGSNRTASSAASSTYSSQRPQQPVFRKGGWAKQEKLKEDDNPWANYGKK